MHKALYLTLVALLGLLVACSTSVDKTPIVAEHATIELYAIQGDPTGLGHLSLPFVANSENVIINVLADVNNDGTFDPTELLIENMPARAREGNINRYAFEVPDSFPDEVNLRVYTSTQALMELDDSYTSAVATVTTLDVDDSIAVSAPGAHPDLKRGSFITLVSALEDGASEREGDIPDLKGGPMDCFPIATANNLISLANTHGIRDKLPEDPQDMIDEMKDDMQYDDGVLKQNYLAGKQAFIDRYDLPIVTTAVERPSYDDIEAALANDCAVEISTTFLRSRSGKKDTGHVITGVGISADGDDVRLLVHDPATATGDDVYETEMTAGDNQFILIKNYPFWDGIMIIDALYVQCWDDNLAIQMGYDLTSEDEPIGSVNAPFGEGLQTIDTLVIGGKHYPKTQFHIGSHKDVGCDGDHWHANTQVFSVEAPEQGIADPNPSSCGFGIVGTVPEETIELTEEQASKWVGSVLED